jgi:hypothetical protein
LLRDDLGRIHLIWWIAPRSSRMQRSNTDILPCMEATYLVILIATFIGIGVMSLYILLKLFAGQR